MYTIFWYFMIEHEIKKNRKSSIYAKLVFYKILLNLCKKSLQLHFILIISIYKENTQRCNSNIECSFFMGLSMNLFHLASHLFLYPYRVIAF